MTHLGVLYYESDRDLIIKYVFPYFNQ